MPFLIGIDTAFPANYYSQDKLIEELSHLWKGKIRNIDRIKKLHENVQVRGRSLACELTR